MQKIPLVPKAALLSISTINGLCALIFGALILADPTGKLTLLDSITPQLANFPLSHIFFADFFWIGVVMQAMLFIPNAVAVSLIVRRWPSGYPAEAVAGGFLAVWCLIEIIYLPNPLVWVYLVIAGIQIALGIYLTNVQKRIDGSNV